MTTTTPVIKKKDIEELQSEIASNKNIGPLLHKRLSQVFERLQELEDEYQKTLPSVKDVTGIWDLGMKSEEYLEKLHEGEL